MEIKQPKPLYMLFMLEIWERYGYYSLQTIILFNIFHIYLGMSLNEGALYFGAFFSLVFGLVFIGGYVGDKILGAKRTITLGLFILAIGYLVLGLTPFLVELLDISKIVIVFTGISIICTGSGLFKANPSNLLSMCYKKNDPRLKSGFTLFYMAINCGSVIADFFAPIIAKKFGWNIAIFLCFIGLICAIATYVFFRGAIKNVSTEAGKKSINLSTYFKVILIIICLFTISFLVMFNPIYAMNVEIFAILICIIFYAYKIYKESDIYTRKKMFVALVLIIEGIAFFILYSQKSSSINAFTIQNVNPTLLGIKFNPQSFQALNPFWIIILSPVLAKLYIYLEKNKISLSFSIKFATGLTLASFAFLLIYMSKYFASPSEHVSAWWIVFVYMFFSISELLVSALGLAMISDLVPKHIRGTVMGMWFIATAVAGSIGGYIASNIIPSEKLIGIESLNAYSLSAAKFCSIMIIFSILAWILSPLLNKMIKK